MISAFLLAATAAATPAAQPAPATTATPASATASAAKPANKPAVVVKPDPTLIPAQNPFDPQRKPWLLPPPPPPPVPALSNDDIRIHGVIIAGDVRKALIELVAPRLLPPPPAAGKSPARPYRMVTVGDDVGGYRVVDITPAELVFELGGARSNMPFKVAKGRAVAGAAVAPPTTEAVVVVAPMPTVLDGVAPPAADSGSNAAPPPAVAAAVPDAPPPAPAESAAAAQQPAANNASPPSGMSLLEAIQWAKKNAGSNSAANPFAGGGLPTPGK
ncbi:hypothetical protein [Chitinimonas sp.]|uniref:hypothetical protein n=1 Tax=Chitinimonas sp. TaxID=1934313 RepID=UPI0035B37CF0